MSKDTQNAVLVLLSIVVVLVVVLGGGFVYLTYGDTIFNHKNNTKTIIPNKKLNEEQEIALFLEDEKVMELSKVFSGRYLNLTNYKYSNYFYANDNTVVSKLDSNLKVWIVLNKLGLPESILESELKNEYRKVFGNLSGYKRIDKITNCYTYKFLNNKYVKEISDNLCENTNNTVSMVAYATNVTGKNTDIIDIYEYVYFKELKDDGYNYYSDYDKTNLILVSAEDINLFDEYKNNVGLYKYRFVKSNDTYTFYSVEKIK